MIPAGRRQKGKRVELILVHDLKTQGYNSARIPFSGAGHEKGDVKIEIPGTRYGQNYNEAMFWAAEVKARAIEFKTVYALVEMFLKKETNMYLQLSIGSVRAHIAYRFTSLPKFNSESEIPMLAVDFDKDNISVHPAKRLIHFKKAYMKDCDLLVLKGDHKPLLYIAYDENTLPVSS